MNAKDDSRQKIIQAAFEAFGESGYDKTSMDDIVKRSGLSKGTLYWHFKNKHELFVATIQFLFKDADEQLEMLVNQDTPAADRIRLFFAQAMQILAPNPQLVGLLISAFFQSYQNEEAQAVLREFYERYISAIEQLVQQGIDRGEFRQVNPHTAAIAFMAGGDGVALYTLLDPDWDMVEAVNDLVDLLLRGLRKDQPTS